jgi:hypothetical protein
MTIVYRKKTRKKSLNELYLYVQEPYSRGMKRETKKASKEITAVFTTLRRLGAASGERIAAGTGLSAATVGQVLWTLSEAGIVGYSNSSELWYLECSWFYGTDGMTPAVAAEVVLVLNTMRALGSADLGRLGAATGLSLHGAGWACEQLRKAGVVDFGATGWKLAA